jgi:hypothetical protein
MDVFYFSVLPYIGDPFIFFGNEIGAYKGNIYGPTQEVSPVYVYVPYAGRIALFVSFVLFAP